MDIFDEIARFRTAFIANHLSPPDVIILKTRDDGLKLIHAIAKQDRFYVPTDFLKEVMHPDGSVYMEFELVGAKIRYPANRQAMEDGSYKFT